MKNRKSVLTFILLTLLGISSILASFLLSNRTVQANGDWADPDCKCRMKLTFDNSASAENLVDFPVLVVLNPSRIDYSKTNATDIRFYDGGTLLSKETEQWNASGNSYIWVKVPQIDNSNTDYIYAYYNCTSTSNLDDAASVWSGYAMVHHLEETSGTLTDSTSNGNNGTPNGVTQDYSGKIDGADSYNGSVYSIINNSTSLNFGTNSFSLMFWFRSRAVSTQDILDAKGGTATDVVKGYKVVQASGSATGYSFALGNGTKNDRFDTGSHSSWGTDVWTMFAVVVNRTGKRMFAYLNGVGVNNTAITITGGVYNNQILTLGRQAGGSSRYFNGALDEIRILNGAYSADWVKAHYLSTSDQFITYGSEESSTPIPAYSNIATTTTVAGASCEFQVKWTDTNGLDTCIFSTNNTGTWQNETIPVAGTVSWANKTLTLNSSPGTTVGYRWYCNNTLGNTGDTGIRTLVTTGDWVYAKKLYFNNGAIAEDLIDFPVLINLTRAGTDFWGHVGSTINDLKFVDSDGVTDLYFEVEYWNYASQQGLVWVKIPQIDANSASDFIYVFYGNPSPPPSPYLNSVQVWNSNFRMVQHLNQTSGTHFDSTSNHNDGTPIGRVNQGVAGRIDGADNLDFNLTAITYINCGTSQSLNLTAFTIEVWMNRVGTGNATTTGSGGFTGEPLVAKGRAYQDTPLGINVNYFLGVRSDMVIGFDFEDKENNGLNHPLYSTTSISNNQWYYIVATYNGTSALYFDGALNNSTTVSVTPDSCAWVATIGSAISDEGGTNTPKGFFNGTMDEVRISIGARSAQWISAQYLSMSDQYVTFEIGEIVLPIPEYLLGALLALVACFAAFGTYKMIKRPKTRTTPATTAFMQDQ